MTLFCTPSDVIGRQKSKMAAVKPEVLISQLRMLWHFSNNYNYNLLPVTFCAIVLSLVTTLQLSKIKYLKD